jgi:hypothetical protein
MATTYSNTSRPLVQWTFLQYKKTNKISSSAAHPVQTYLHSLTQIGSKLLLFGGCDANGMAQDQLFLYDTQTYQWSASSDVAGGGSSSSGGGGSGHGAIGEAFQEDHPGPRYGHSATLVEVSGDSRWSVHFITFASVLIVI